jgi:hypothetical protein
MVAIDALKKDAIMVLITGVNMYDSPQVVQDAVTSKEAWGAIPIVAVTDANVEKLAGIVPYQAMKDEQGFFAAKTQLAAMRGMEAPIAKAKTEHKPETWLSVEGRKIQAAFVAQTDGVVTLRLSNGRDVTFSTDRLDPSSRERAAKLAAQ